jgi:IclR family pca regulon transcriptional regulator
MLDRANEIGGESGAGRRNRVGRDSLAAGDQEFIQSLAKGLAVIEAFSESRPQMTLSEVSRRVGLSPGSARRVLHTLQLLGYASCQGTRFELTPRVLQLGYSYLTSLPVASLVRPRLSELTEEVGANCAVSVLDGVDTVFVARTTAKQTARELLGVGTRFPAHTTSAGKVLLAELSRDEVERLYAGRELEAVTPNTISSIGQLHEALEKVRADGWALNDQEAMIGHRSITVPVRVNGRAVAAVGVGAHVAVASVARMMESFLPPLQVTAEAIAQLLWNHASAQTTGRSAAHARGRGAATSAPQTSAR